MTPLTIILLSDRMLDTQRDRNLPWQVKSSIVTVATTCLLHLLVGPTRDRLIWIFNFICITLVFWSFDKTDVTLTGVKIETSGRETFTQSNYDFLFVLVGLAYVVLHSIELIRLVKQNN